MLVLLPESHLLLLLLLLLLLCFFFLFFCCHCCFPAAADLASSVVRHSADFWSNPKSSCKSFTAWEKLRERRKDWSLGPYFKHVAIALALFPLGKTRLPADYHSLHTLAFAPALPFLLSLSMDASTSLSLLRLHYASSDKWARNGRSLRKTASTHFHQTPGKKSHPQRRAKQQLTNNQKNKKKKLSYKGIFTLGDFHTRKRRKTAIRTTTSPRTNAKYGKRARRKHERNSTATKRPASARAHTHTYTQTPSSSSQAANKHPFANKTPNTNRLGTQKERSLARSVAPNKPPLQQQPPTYPQFFFLHN